jgi:hypothetical protein
MAVTTQVTHDELIITLTGIDALWALKRKLVVSRSSITSAKVFDRKATIRLLRLRLWGSYLPGVVCAGTFSVSKKVGLPTGQSRLHVGLPGQTGAGGDDLGQTSINWRRNTPTRSICRSALGVTVYPLFI